MDDRWRFLYCGGTEMWGHAWEAGAGNGKPGPSTVPAGEAKPPGGWEGATGTEAYSREAREPCVEKSRYRFHCTRTVNRHRWMGRGSQGRRKKHCQGTRQNDPVTSGEGVPSKEGRRDQAQATV